MPATPTLAPASSRKAALGPPIVLAAATLLLTFLFGAVGQGPGGSALVGILTVVSVALHAGLFAGAYVLGSIGLGRLPLALVPRLSPHRLWLQPALGVGYMLFLSHLLGCLGLLSGDDLTPRIVAWVPIVLGIVLLLHQLTRGDLVPERWSPLPWVAVFASPSLATLIVAAANPPGWLWESEFGAYDALSYHLQLTKEWAVGGIEPAAHNVYSFLPSYVESAYLHLGQMMIAVPSGVRSESVIDRMVGGDGTWVYACHYLHAMLGVLAAIVCGRGAWAAAAVSGATGPVAKLAGLAASIVVLGTGWTVVCGSLAYNEMGVVLLAAAALLLCFDLNPGGEPGSATGRLWPRTLLIGLLVGLEVSCKPTALLLVGPSVGLLMLAMLPRRQWPAAILAGSIGGAAAIAPWLIRNALVAGNPVFPFAAGLLGSGHWSAEQLARYIAAHGFDGSLGQRLALLFSDRGWLNALWGATPWLALASLFVALRAARTRRSALAVRGGLACGLVAWLFFTHLQSRFLVPLLAPMSLLLGLGIAAAMPAARGPNLRAGALAYVFLLVLLCLPWLPVAAFLSQRGGQPNALLIGGVAEFTGALRADELDPSLDEAERRATLHAVGPFEYINVAITGEPVPPGRGSSPRPSAVYLLGDATPLYYLSATGRPDAGVIYHTTWDTSPLGDAIRAAPDDPAAWTASLLARGIGYVLVNPDELYRLAEKDRYFDSDITTERVRGWLADPRSGCEVVRTWPAPGDSATSPARPGRILVRLHAGARGDR